MNIALLVTQSLSTSLLLMVVMWYMMKVFNATKTTRLKAVLSVGAFVLVVSLVNGLNVYGPRIEVNSTMYHGPAEKSAVPASGDLIPKTDKFGRFDKRIDSEPVN